MAFLIIMSVIVFIVFASCNRTGWKADFLNSGFAKGLFRAPATENSIVGICQSDDPMLDSPVDIDQKLTIEEVDAVTRKAVERAGGLDNIVDNGDWVLIKVNMILHDSPILIKGSATDLRIVKSLIRQLIEQGRARRITIGEGAAFHPGDVPFKVDWEHYGNLSYDGIVKDLDATTDIQVDRINFNRESEASPFKKNLPVPGGGLERDSYTIPSAITDCDKFFVVSVMKTHVLVNATLTLKNYIGISPSSIYGVAGVIGHLGVPHSELPFGLIAPEFSDTTDRTVVDLFSYHPADFGIIGCFRGMEGNGPVNGHSVRRNIVLAGADPLALDAVGSYYMGMNPWDLDYLHWAFMKGHGNTFDLKKITVNGPDNTGGPAMKMIDEIRNLYAFKAFNKPWIWPFQGRGIRMWLLNGPHDGSDIELDYLDGQESSVSPVEDDMTAGKKWTFFADYNDHMDLESFYKGPSNCMTYAYTTVVAEQPMDTQLRFASDNGIKIILNGETVYTKQDTGAFLFVDGIPLPWVEKKVAVHLKKGVNRLLVKVYNRSNAYGFSMFVSEPDGDTPIGIRYEVPRI